MIAFLTVMAFIVIFGIFYVYIKKEDKQQTCCYCKCGNELIGSNSLLKDTNYVYFKCSKCGIISKWDFDIPCPFLVEEDINEEEKNIMELGNLIFNTNTNQQYDCPEYVVALLREIDRKLEIYLHNNYGTYGTPFDNSGDKFENDTFKVEAYNWNDDYNQLYNFKYKDIEISWYKYLGRDTTINKKISHEEAIDMFAECITSIEKMEVSDE